MSRRRVGLLLSGALHLSGLALLLSWVGPGRPPARDETRVSVFIVAAKQPAARPQDYVQRQASAARPTAPQSVTPNTAAPLQPEHSIAETGSSGLHVPAAPATHTHTNANTDSAPVPTPARLEPQLVAASLPPEHQPCSASSTERHYPSLLRERGLQGLVMLLVQVDEQGRAAAVQVKQGSGLRLFDEAAARVAQACSFLPARRGEQAVASWVEYPVRFALRNNTQ